MTKSAYWILISLNICFFPAQVFSGAKPIPNQNAIHIPAYVKFPPKGHFAGISIPSVSLTEARRSAVYDAIRQVLRTMGADYSNEFIDIAHADTHPAETRRYVNDCLTGISKGFLLGIEQNIVESDWVRNNFGKYVCFILVRYPDNLLDEMRRLSKGARVIAFPYKKDNRNLSFSLTETNGVSVVLSSAKVTVLKKNRFSSAVSFFIWPVPEGDTKEKAVIFQPIRLRSNSSMVNIPIDDIGKNLKDYLLGAEINRSVVFYGFDELGRTVTATTEF